MSEHTPIEFYFEFASPYAYFASLKVDGIGAKYGRRVEWRPMLLGAALKVTGSRPNVRIPMKGEYFLRDIRRCARLLGVPFTLPDVMPMNGLAACRAYYWLYGSDPQKAKELAQAVYNAHWGLGRDMSDAAEVARVAEPLGIDAAELVAATQDPVVKERTREATDEAVERGVFGSPFIFVDDEPFWGHDRLDQVERWLGTGGW